LGNLQGHSGWINDVRIFEGGQKLLSVADDNSVFQWDVNTLERLNTYQFGNDRSVKSCDVDRSGNLFIIANDDGNVMLWDMRQWRKVRDITKHTGPATSCSFSPQDYYTVVSSGWDKKVFVSDSRKEKSSRELSGHEDWVLASALSSDGQTAISGGWDKAICLWNVSSGILRTKLTDAHTRTVTSVSFSDDNRLFASSSYDGSVKLWNSVTTKQEKLLVGHHGHVNKVIFTPKSENAIITAGSDHTVRLWDLSRGVIKNEFVCQGPATTLHCIKNQHLMMAFGDSIGNLYLAKYKTDASV